MSSTTAASRKLKRLCVCVALAAVVVLCMPLVQRLLGFSAFPLSIRLSSGAFAFCVMAPALWVALSPRSDVTRSIALSIITFIIVLFGVLFVWLHLWSLHT